MLRMLALKLGFPMLYVLCLSLYAKRIADFDGWLNYRQRETKEDWAVGCSVRVYSRQWAAVVGPRFLIEGKFLS